MHLRQSDSILGQATDQMFAGHRIELSLARGFWVNALLVLGVTATLLSWWVMHISRLTTM